MFVLIKSVHLVGIINGIPCYIKVHRSDSLKFSLNYSFPNEDRFLTTVQLKLQEAQ
jgi:hypothetical protein